MIQGFNASLGQLEEINVAGLTPDQAVLVYADGTCGKTALYSLKNVTAGDTADLAKDFKVVKRAGIVSSTGTTIAAVTLTGNTGVTIPVGPAAAPGTCKDPEVRSAIVPGTGGFARRAGCGAPASMADWERAIRGR